MTDTGLTAAYKALLAIALAYCWPFLGRRRARFAKLLLTVLVLV